MLSPMAWFGDVFRRGAGAPAWAPFFSAGQFAIFSTLIESELRGLAIHFSVEDAVVAVGEGDDARRYGLLELARACARLPPERWVDLVRIHFDRVFAADHESRALGERIGELDAVRSLLRVRLFPPDVAGDERITWPVADGLVAALVFDLPSAIRTVSPAEADRWGVPLEELRAAALGNLALERAPEREPFDADGVTLHAIHGESFFTATHALVLPAANDAVLHPHGALVTAPTRHGVIWHAIHDLAVVRALHALARIGDGMFHEGPGGISPHVYWARGGRWMRSPVELDEGRVSVTPPEPFVAMLDALAKNAPS